MLDLYHLDNLLTRKLSGSKIMLAWYPLSISCLWKKYNLQISFVFLSRTLIKSSLQAPKIKVIILLNH